jgi:4'-phosphopantetheinyl transferase
MNPAQPRLAAHVNWPPRPGRPCLGPRDVDVWATPLDYPAEQKVRPEAVLNQLELARAGRFRFERDRCNFIAGRAFLRKTLAEYLQADPRELLFAYTETGKPFLDGRFSRSGFCFNLAHTGNFALLAVTRLGAVGVDVECVRPLEDMERLVQSFFSPREVIAFMALPPEERPAAFYRLWTRKEAWLKAVGEGIAHLLSHVEVTFLANESARLLRVPHSYGTARDWSLWDLQPAPGFAAAVSLRAAKPWIRCWSWNPGEAEVTNL